MQDRWNIDPNMDPNEQTFRKQAYENTISDGLLESSGAIASPAIVDAFSALQSFIEEQNPVHLQRFIRDVTEESDPINTMPILADVDDPNLEPDIKAYCQRIIDSYEGLKLNSLHLQRILGAPVHVDGDPQLAAWAWESLKTRILGNQYPRDQWYALLRGFQLIYIVAFPGIPLPQFEKKELVMMKANLLLGETTAIPKGTLGRVQDCHPFSDPQHREVEFGIIPDQQIDILSPESRAQGVRGVIAGVVYTIPTSHLAYPE